jgi:hypothetical protein
VVIGCENYGCSLGASDAGRESGRVGSLAMPVTQSLSDRPCVVRVVVHAKLPLTFLLLGTETGLEPSE